MDFLLSHWAELGTLVTTGWAWWERRKRKRAVLELEAKLEAVSDIGQRYAKALQRGDLDTMRAIERERRERGL